MSSQKDPLDDVIDRFFIKKKELIPDYSLVELEIMNKLCSGPETQLYKMWRQGRLMEDIYTRSKIFYRPPNWYLIFQLGPSTVRLYIKRTMRTLIRMAQIKTFNKIY